MTFSQQEGDFHVSETTPVLHRHTVSRISVCENVSGLFACSPSTTGDRRKASFLKMNPASVEMFFSHRSWLHTTYCCYKFPWNTPYVLYCYQYFHLSIYLPTYLGHDVSSRTLSVPWVCFAVSQQDMLEDPHLGDLRKIFYWIFWDFTILLRCPLTMIWQGNVSSL